MSAVATLLKRRKKGSDKTATMPIMEHLYELRNRIMICVAAFVVGAIVAFMEYHRVLHLLTQPYCDVLYKRFGPDKRCALVVTGPLDGFSSRLRVTGYLGAFIASPIILWQIWRFVTPGLKSKEKRYALPFVLSSIALFSLGAAVAFWTLPNALQFLIDIGGKEVEPLYTPNSFLKLITLMMVAFGIAFEFPVVLVFLQLIHVVTPKNLSKYRRHAIVGIFVAAAVLTPSQDPYSLFAMALPMCVFYEASILIGKLLRR